MCIRDRYRELGLPTSHTEWVDVAINKRKMRRLMVEDHNDRLLERYHEDQARRNPGTEVEPTDEAIGNRQKQALIRETEIVQGDKSGCGRHQKAEKYARGFHDADNRRYGAVKSLQMVNIHSMAPTVATSIK
mgnify:CR=1 FL=1